MDSQDIQYITTTQLLCQNISNLYMEARLDVRI
jgi:hypothetical protein